MPPRKQKDPIKAAAREGRAQRRVGEGAMCACGEARPEALIAGRKEAICFNCDAQRRGKSAREAHHVAGRANSPVTLDVSINDHRAELSIAQYDWPKQTLRNPEASPLLAAAGGIRGFIDTLLFLIGKLLAPIPDALEAYDTQLRERLGPQWWLHVRDDQPPK
jgi:hypothetical protein